LTRAATSAGPRAGSAWASAAGAAPCAVASKVAGTSIGRPWNATVPKPETGRASIFAAGPGGGAASPTRAGRSVPVTENNGSPPCPNAPADNAGAERSSIARATFHR